MTSRYTELELRAWADERGPRPQFTSTDAQMLADTIKTLTDVVVAARALQPYVKVKYGMDEDVVNAFNDALAATKGLVP